jgi:hypothetical protein
MREVACEVGIPSGVVINNRRYIIDEVLGTVDVFCSFAGIAVCVPSDLGLKYMNLVN